LMVVIRDQGRILWIDLHFYPVTGDPWLVFLRRPVDHSAYGYLVKR